VTYQSGSALNFEPRMVYKALQHIFLDSLTQNVRSHDLEKHILLDWVRAVKNHSF
jgi:hypothetical protein